MHDLVIEIGYRFWIYNYLKAQLLERQYVGGDGNKYISISVYDENVGFRYVKNHGNLTNSHGHVSSKEYSLKKPDNQYRIAIIGDSYTACPFCEHRPSWSEYLESDLAGNSKWKKKTAGKETLVVNFARDGSGIRQFGRIYEYEVILFDPDIVIIDFISDDIWRDIYFRGMVNFQNTQELETAITTILWEMLSRTFYPLLLADRLGDRSGFTTNSATLLKKWQLKTLSDVNKGAYPVSTGDYLSAEEGIRVSLDALTAITRNHDNVVILHHPSIHDMQGNGDDVLNGRRKKMLSTFRSRAEDLGLDIEYMLNHLPELATGDFELFAWFSQHDHHPTEIMHRTYSARVAQYIASLSTGTATD